MAFSPLFDIYDPLGTLRQDYQYGVLPDDGEEMDPIGVVPLRKRRPQITDLMPDEQKQGMLRSLANAGASGLTGLGWLLDTPGAFIRGTISGIADGDPLKGVRSVFSSSDERVSGRDLLRQFGMADTGDNWGNFTGGLAAEILTDPLTYLNPFSILGRGALGASGRALDKAGVLDNAALLARNQDMGVREFLRQPARKIIAASDNPNAMRDFGTAARAKGLDVDELLNQPAAGLAELRIPLSSKGTLLGTGEFGDWVARGVDAFGEGLTTNRFTAPIANRAVAAFDPSVMGELDRGKQWRNRAAWNESLNNEREFLEWATEQQRAANKVGQVGQFSFNSPRIQNAVRDTIEANLDPERIAQLQDQEAIAVLESVPEWKAWRDNAADKLREARERRAALGLLAPDAPSLEGTGFFPSQSVWFNTPQAPDLPNRIGRRSSAYERGSRVLNVDDVVGRARSPKTDLERRSETFRRLMAGDEGRALQDRLIAASPEQTPGILDEAFRALGMDAPFSKVADEGLTVADLDQYLAQTDIAPADRRRYTKMRKSLLDQQAALKTELGDTLRLADRQFATSEMGLFDQSTVNDMLRYGIGQARSEANARVVLDDLLENVSPIPAQAVAGGGSLNLLDAAQQLGYDKSSLTNLLRERLGEDVDFSKLSDNEKVVENLKRLAPGRMAKEQGAGSKLWNTYTNAFKIGALANPAYHTRNLYSGFLSTLTVGDSNPITNAINWYAGRQAGLGNYTERGLFGLMPSVMDRIRKIPRYANLPDDEALDLFLAEAGRNRLGGGLIDDVEGVAEQSSKGLYPGADAKPAPPLIGEGGILYDKDRTLPEWATVRGVDWSGILKDRPAPAETLNPLLQLHERVGRQVEDANRLGTYLSELQGGASPDAAARQVYKTQVDYSPRAFTEFERALKRVVPFYSYTRGITPLVAENILYRPQGMQGQVTRAISRATEPNDDNFLPEHLRQSASIPIPGAPSENLQRVVHSIDLPWEAPINLISPGIGNTAPQQFSDTLQKTGMNLLGQLNPLIKAPLEMILNRQLYSGRELSDLYSVLEKDIGPWGRIAEQLVVNLPGGSKLDALYRTARDNRLTPLQRALKIFVNNTLGGKVTDIDKEQAKRKAARTALNELLSVTPGVRTYENLTVPEDALRAMPKDQQDMYLLYKIIQSEAAKMGRDRKRAEIALDPLELLGAVQNRG